MKTTAKAAAGPDEGRELRRRDWIAEMLGWTRTPEARAKHSAETLAVWAQWAEQRLEVLP